MGLLYQWGDYGVLESPQMAYHFFIRAKEMSEALTLLITSQGFGVASPEKMKLLWEEAERRATFGDSELQEVLGLAYARIWDEICSWNRWF